MASTQSDQPQSDVKHRKGYTPPKGRPTTHSYGDVKRSRLSPTMEWVIAVIVICAVLGAIVYFGAGLGSNGGGHGGGGGGHGAPAPIVEVVGDPI